MAKPPVAESAGSISYTFLPPTPVKNFARHPPKIKNRQSVHSSSYNLRLSLNLWDDGFPADSKTATDCGLWIEVWSDDTPVVLAEAASLKSACDTRSWATFRTHHQTAVAPYLVL